MKTPQKHLDASAKWKRENYTRVLEYNRQWRLKNMERYAERAKRFAKAHPELTSRASKKYRQRHPDRIYKINHRYQQKHPALWLFHSGKRKKVITQATPSWADLKQINQIYVERDRLNKLEGLHYNASTSWVVDHNIPLQGKTVSGLHVHTNLVLMRRCDNTIKLNHWSES